MKMMRVAQISAPKANFEIVERPMPEPTPGTIRIKVAACGICHSDALVKEGLWPGLQYPRVPGHEIAGTVDALGTGVQGWKPGQLVGVGWHGGYCGRCEPCRRGNLFACATQQVTGISFDGGYGEYMLAPASAVAKLPDEMPAIDAAPLLCAGITTFNALRNSPARPGDLVAVLGLGGLGHLGVQYAAKAGFRVAAIARGKEKESLACQLGASHYIDSLTQDPASELQKLGGASVILATVTVGDAMNATIGGLAVNGTLLVIGAPPSLEITPFTLIGAQRSLKGWYSGTSIDSEDTLAFSARAGVHSMNEVFTLDRVAEAYDRMASGKARFRVVLAMN
ncbi:MAG: alcohol dehydrogenase catalytic domain-containing protein [Haliea sp.]|nr:alcohol dehydrogenase catalytic domain-containing protein [Haliea sp.]